MFEFFNFFLLYEVFDYSGRETVKSQSILNKRIKLER